MGGRTAKRSRPQYSSSDRDMRRATAPGKTPGNARFLREVKSRDLTHILTSAEHALVMSDAGVGSLVAFHAIGKWCATHQSAPRRSWCSASHAARIPHPHAGGRGDGPRAAAPEARYSKSAEITFGEHIRVNSRECRNPVLRTPGKAAYRQCRLCDCVAESRFRVRTPCCRDDSSLWRSTKGLSWA